MNKKEKLSAEIQRKNSDGTENGSLGVSSKGTNVNIPQTISKTTLSEDDLSRKESVDAAYDVVSMVDSLLGQLGHKFEVLSGEILSKMNKMTEQLNTLETSLNDMLAEGQLSDKSDV